MHRTVINMIALQDTVRDFDIILYGANPTFDRLEDYHDDLRQRYPLHQPQLGNALPNSYLFLNKPPAPPPLSVEDRIRSQLQPLSIPIKPGRR